jgi:hypothetical protein
VIIFIEQDVFGFYVSVDDGRAPGVEIRDGFQNLFDHLFCGSFI